MTAPRLPFAQRLGVLLLPLAGLGLPGLAAAQQPHAPIANAPVLRASPLNNGMAPGAFQILISSMSLMLRRLKPPGRTSPEFRYPRPVKV
jgi:hypothetical protein